MFQFSPRRRNPLTCLIEIFPPLIFACRAIQSTDLRNSNDDEVNIFVKRQLRDQIVTKVVHLNFNGLSFHLKCMHTYLSIDLCNIKER